MATWTHIGMDGSRWFVVPTRNLRDLILRHRLEILPGNNYVLGWKDAKGWGLELAVVDWDLLALPSGRHPTPEHPYVNM